METWESHFREKSRRRSSRPRVTVRAVAGWTLAAALFFAFVVALLEAVQV